MRLNGNALQHKLAGSSAVRACRAIGGTPVDCVFAARQAERAGRARRAGRTGRTGRSRRRQSDDGDSSRRDSGRAQHRLELTARGRGLPGYEKGAHIVRREVGADTARVRGRHDATCEEGLDVQALVVRRTEAQPPARQSEVR